MMWRIDFHWSIKPIFFFILLLTVLFYWFWWTGFSCWFWRAGLQLAKNLFHLLANHKRTENVSFCILFEHRNIFIFLFFYAKGRTLLRLFHRWNHGLNQAECGPTHVSSIWKIKAHIEKLDKRELIYSPELNRINSHPNVILKHLGLVLVQHNIFMNFLHQLEGEDQWVVDGRIGRVLFIGSNILVKILS